MTRVLLVGVVLAVPSFFPTPVHAQLQSEARANNWHSNYDEARATARRTNKPMMIVFRCVP
jgi:hypothetical protein